MGYFILQYLTYTRYKYVSYFAIKLLKEGFDLHEHLMALRRYHFMEQADWADSFIISLRNQVIFYLPRLLRILLFLYVLLD